MRVSYWKFSLNWCPSRVRRCPHFAGEIGKRCFHSENVTYQICFRPHSPEEFKIRQSPVSLDLSLRKTRSGKSHDKRHTIVLEKLRFFHCFPRTRKRKAGVCKFLRFEEHFRNAPLVSVVNRLNRRNKTAFSNFLGAVWTVPKPPSFQKAFWMKILIQASPFPVTPPCLLFISYTANCQNFNTQECTSWDNSRMLCALNTKTPAKGLMAG